MYTRHPNTNITSKINPSTFNFSTSRFKRGIFHGAVEDHLSPCLTSWVGLLATGGGSFTGSSSLPLKTTFVQMKRQAVRVGDLYCPSPHGWPRAPRSLLYVRRTCVLCGRVLCLKGPPSFPWHFSV